MKIIFSRKGFDTRHGGFPSPIFPDGSCYSIPIPGKLSSKKYSDLTFQYEGETIQKILNDLTNKNIKINGKTKSCDYSSGKFLCHHDPLLIKNNFCDVYALGQAGSALGHLRNKNIKKDDIFLFYGLFREVEKINGIWKYKKDSKPLHLIFSYMKIEDIVNISDKEMVIKNHPCLQEHPHLNDAFVKKYGNKNNIFIGKEYKIFKYNNKRVLTDLDAYKGASKWKIPVNFDFSQYISFIKNIQIIENSAIIKYRGYGQEFVLDLDMMKKEEQRENIIYYINNILDIC